MLAPADHLFRVAIELGYTLGMANTDSPNASAVTERYPEITVRGAPRELGRGIGEATREMIRGFLAYTRDRLARFGPVSPEEALAAAVASRSFAEEYSQDLFAELSGMAEGSGVSVDEMVLLQVRNQLRRNLTGGCTAIALSRTISAAGTGIVAQNWDNEPRLDEFTVVLTRRPEGKPATLTITQAGLIAYLGLNEAGIGLCMNTLPAPSRYAGVPHYFTVAGMYETRSLDAAVAAVRRAHRAIPANIILSTPQGPADLEITVDGVYVLQDQHREAVTHTNHCLHPEIRAIGDSFPELIQSRARKARIDRLLAEARRPLRVSDVEQMLTDHEDHPRSICRHSNDDAETGFWATVFSVVVEAERGLLHVSRGNPCSREYRTYRLQQ